MKRCAVFLVLGWLAGIVHGQVPPATDEGRTALKELTDRCLANGAFRRTSVAKTGHQRLVLVDKAKLQATLREQRKLLTPALRDSVIATALISAGEADPPDLVLLRAVAEEMDDNRARAFAAHFAGNVARVQGNFAAAQSQMSAALRLFAGLKDSFWQARCLIDLGRIDHEQGNLALALEHYQASLDLFRRLSGERAVNVASCRNGIALVYLDLGKEDEALALLQQAQKTEEELSGEDSPRSAVGLVNLGTVYARRGDYDKALKHYQKAALILRGGPTGRDDKLAATLAALGDAYLHKQEYGKALERHQESLEITIGLYGEIHPEVARSLHNLASVYHAQGQYDQELKYYLRALKVREQVLNANHPVLAQTYHNLGVLHSAKGEYEQALVYCQKALAIRQKAFGPHHEAVADSWQALSLIHYHRGEYAKSVECNGEALQALRRIPGDAPLVLGRLKAEDLVLRSLSVDVLQARVSCLTKTFGKMPTVPQLEECNHLLALAVDLVEQTRQRLLETSESKLMLGAQRSDLFHLWIGSTDLLHRLDKEDKHLHTAFQAAEKGTARVFLEQLGQTRARLLTDVSQTLQAQESARTTDVRGLDYRIDKEQAKPESQRDGKVLIELYAQRKQLDEKLHEIRHAIAAAQPRYAAWTYAAPCTLAEARACLGPREVGLFFFLAGGASHVLLVEDATAPGPGLAIFPLPAAEEIGVLVDALTDQPTLTLSARTRALGAEGFTKLLGPLWEKIKDKDLVIVPSGSLCHLPFELLVEPGESRFLIETNRIRYAPSFTILHVQRRWFQNPNRPKPQRLLWAMADPIYESGDERLAGKGKPAFPGSKSALLDERPRSGPGKLLLPRLKHSRKEVEGLAKLVGPAEVTLLLYDRASEAAVKAASASGNLQQYRYLHFATHGTLDRDGVKQPALVLSLVGNTSEDGFLQMDEIAILKLNADLVVLSACHTGQGRLRPGEGVTGLARAFLYAGSKGVVCSLWSVDDLETSHLMVDFYRNLQQGESAPEALRAAQLAMIRAGKPPIYWAPFILIGE